MCCYNPVAFNSSHVRLQAAAASFIYSAQVFHHQIHFGCESPCSRFKLFCISLVVGCF
jgi:hypothetical protein